jgi:hypothetical protein
MRPATFDSIVVRRYLRAHKIANLAELKVALGTAADITVFRKLRPLEYLTSYTHRGSYYTLAEIAHFDDQGLWLLPNTPDELQRLRLEPHDILPKWNYTIKPNPA